MKRHHRREKVCHTRPAYRDGRKEKAIKVYTINDESCYVLVQGVPALKLTKELLDLCSLYGAIHEYRLLADFPEKEEFTEVYWIQYQHIQAARVAKRKLDDHPFYGGILHVCYAPEYESEDDTRQKLQGRRKAIAKRIRIMQAQQKDDTKEPSEPTTSTDTSIDSIGAEPGSSIPAEHTHPEPTAIDTRLSPGQDLQQYLLPPHGIPKAHRTDRDAPGFPHIGTFDGKNAQQYPLPPNRIPEAHWTDRDASEFPRIRTSHATLPADFNPYPDDAPPPIIPPQKEKLHAQPLGPHLTSGDFSTQGFEPGTARDAKDTKTKTGTLGQHNDSNFRRIGRKRQSCDISQQANVSKPDRPVKKRALDRCSVPRAQTVASVGGGAMLLPRNVQKSLSQGNTGGESVSDARHQDVAPPDTGDSSLDTTVQHIRKRMRAVTESRGQDISPAVAPVVAAEESNEGQRAATDRPAVQRSGLTKKTRRKI